MEIVNILSQLLGVESGTITAIFALLWAVSEALSLIPSIKANGIFQLFCQFLGKCKQNN